VSFYGFCQNRNVVYREGFKPEEVEEISVNLRFENISATTINGPEIVIEIGTNNKRILPTVEHSDNKLSITQNSWDFNTGDVCDVYIYVPAKYAAQNWTLSTQYGNIDLDSISALSSINLKIGQGLCSLANLKTDYFRLNVDADNSGVDINNMDCSYFDIFGFIGKVSMTLKHAPLAKSLIRTKEGAINLSIPKSDSFEISARSNNSSLINNYSKSKKAIPDWVKYVHNQGGPLIEIQTFKGDITIGE